jgi:hypothetical protein
MRQSFRSYPRVLAILAPGATSPAVPRNRPYPWDRTVSRQAGVGYILSGVVLQKRCTRTKDHRASICRHCLCWRSGCPTLTHIVIKITRKLLDQVDITGLSRRRVPPALVRLTRPKPSSGWPVSLPDVTLATGSYHQAGRVNQSLMKRYGNRNAEAYAHAPGERQGRIRHPSVPGPAAA